MNLEIFCVRDVKTDQFGTPMFLISVGQAVRSFTDEVNRAEKDNQLYAHPEDFELFHLGCFSTGNAQFSVHEPVSVSHGSYVAMR